MVDITSDIINIDLDNMPTFELNDSHSSSSSAKPSVNFGGGIELLMNDKRVNGGSSKKKSAI